MVEGRWGVDWVADWVDVEVDAKQIHFDEKRYQSEEYQDVLDNTDGVFNAQVVSW